MLAQSVEEGGADQLGTVVAAQAPADDAPAFEIHDNRQVIKAATQSQISEVLTPSTGGGHAAVVPAVLGPL